MRALALALAALFIATTALAEDDGYHRLIDEMGALDEFPCDTTLYFVHIRGEWYVTCPDCAAIPARQVYPKHLIADVDALSIDGRLPFMTIMVGMGLCPENPPPPSDFQNCPPHPKATE